MVLGKLPVCVWGGGGGAGGGGRPTIRIIVGQGPTALAVGADGGGLDIFFSHLSFLFSFSLWETARYRLKCCPKGPSSPKQPTNQPAKNQLDDGGKVQTY